MEPATKPRDIAHQHVEFKDGSYWNCVVHVRRVVVALPTYGVLNAEREKDGADRHE